MPTAAFAQLRQAHYTPFYALLQRFSVFSEIFSGEFRDSIGYPDWLMFDEVVLPES